MIKHAELGPASMGTSRKLKRLIDDQLIRYGGNARLNIYGTLQCASGKRMKVSNRVFFSSEQEAVAQGFRPCGHCMREAYLRWKANQEIIPKP